jgi:hypothetical protein
MASIQSQSEHDMFDLPKPAMSEARIQALTEQLKKAHTYIEFGMGGSTNLAAYLGVENIVSTDSSPEWINNVSQNIAKINSQSKSIQLLHADLGELGEWGHPKGSEMIHNWPSYFHGPWKLVRSRGLHPDTVLIDGRFRVACFLYSLFNLDPGAIIMWDDYTPRPEYHVVESILKPYRYVDDMAFFERPAAIDERQVLPLLFDSLYSQN